VKRLLGIGLIVLAGVGLVACGDDDDDATVTEPAIEIETPEATGPATTEDATTPTAPPGETTTTPPAGGEGASGKRPEGKRPGKHGGETADLPECADIGGGPAPCRRPDGTVRVPERL
jgi:hypothetical protein